MSSYSRIYNAGEQKYLGVDVTSSDAFTVTNPEFSLVRCSDNSVVIAITAAEQEALSNGTRVKYNLDATGLSAGEYLAVFEFDRDGIEHRVETQDILIKALEC